MRFGHVTPHITGTVATTDYSNFVADKESKQRALRATSDTATSHTVTSDTATPDTATSDTASRYACNHVIKSHQE